MKNMLKMGKTGPKQEEKQPKPIHNWSKTGQKCKCGQNRKWHNFQLVAQDSGEAY